MLTRNSHTDSHFSRALRVLIVGHSEFIILNISFFDVVEMASPGKEKNHLFPLRTGFEGYSLVGWRDSGSGYVDATSPPQAR